MWSLIKMEYNTLEFKSDKRYLFLIVIIPVILFRFVKFVEFEAFYIILSFFFPYLLSMYTIGPEKPESHYLINSLPISKAKLVLGKHIFIHLCLLVTWVYLALYLAAMKVVEFKDLDINYLNTAMLLMIIILNIIIIFMNKSGFFSKVIYSGLFGYSLWFLTDFEVIDYLSKYKMNIILLALLSIGISLIISMHLYKKREFARG